MRKLLLALVFFLFACTPADYSQIKVEKVIDGDTVILSTGQSLRYIGIDSPETWIRRGDEFVYEPEPFGPEATQFNKELVEGKRVRVEFDLVRKDRYGRLLGYCFIDDFFVNEELIRQGYAVLYTFPPNVKYVDLLVEAQKDARKNRRGIWQMYETISHSQAQDYIGQVRAVRGRVLSTYESDRIIFLNFGPDYKKDFTAVIFKNVLKFFDQKGIDPAEFYKGRVVEVSGVIGEHNGPEITVSSPTEIRVIDD